MSRPDERLDGPDATGADAPSPIDPPPSVEAAEESPIDVDALGQEVVALRELVVTLAADLERHRRLLAQHVEDRARVRVTALVTELLPALDTVTYAAHYEGPVEPVTAQALERTLAEALARHGVTTVGEVGAEFDPRLHEALEAPATADGYLLVEAVLRPGYLLDGHVLRPATVRLRVA